MSFYLYIFLNHIFLSNTNVLHRFIRINVNLKFCFKFCLIWAKLSELGRALKAIKFATICKVSSDWPLFQGCVQDFQQGGVWRAKPGAKDRINVCSARAGGRRTPWTPPPPPPHTHTHTHAPVFLVLSAAGPLRS